MQTEVEVKNELIPMERINVPQLFTDMEKAKAIVAAIRAKASEHEPDIETDAGRKACASNAYKVSQSKTFLDGLGKEFLADVKAQVKSGDAVRRYIKDECDAIRDDVRRPLTEYEDAEKKRIADEKALAEYLAEWDDALAEDDLFNRQREFNRKEAELERYNSMLKHINDCAMGFIGGSPHPYAILMRELEEKVVIDDSYGPYMSDLILARDNALKKVENAHKAQVKRDREEAERIEKERIEREDRIAREAAESAREEAEAKQRLAEEQAAAAKKEALWRSRLSMIPEAKWSGQEAFDEFSDEVIITYEDIVSISDKEFAAVVAHRESVLELRAEREKKEAAEQARRDRAIAEERAREEKERAIKEAQEKERQRIEAEQRAKADKEAKEKAEAERLARNKAHRKKINNAALACFENHGVSADTGKEIIRLIASGLIDHIKIEY